MMYAASIKMLQCKYPSVLLRKPQDYPLILCIILMPCKRSITCVCDTGEGRGGRREGGREGGKEGRLRFLR